MYESFQALLQWWNVMGRVAGLSVTAQSLALYQQWDRTYKWWFGDFSDSETEVVDSVKVSTPQPSSSEMRRIESKAKPQMMQSSA